MHPRTVVRPPWRTPLCQTPFQTNPQRERRSYRAFTLIELLVVIAIIAILIGLLFPAFKAVQNQARQVQAKNDLTQIVNAVNAYYTEYGQYPLSITTEKTYGPGGNPTTNDTLFTELRGCTAATGSCPAAATTNTRQIVFISPPDVKNSANPRSGIATQTVTVNGVSIPRGSYVDPWGTNYVVRIDGGYDNQVANPYSDTDQSAGANPLRLGVIAWSYGIDQALGTAGNGLYKNSDDVISWQ